MNVNEDSKDHKVFRVTYLYIILITTTKAMYKTKKIGSGNTILKAERASIRAASMERNDFSHTYYF